jgi:hypothetical protein
MSTYDSIIINIAYVAITTIACVLFYKYGQIAGAEKMRKEFAKQIEQLEKTRRRNIRA